MSKKTEQRRSFAEIQSELQPDALTLDGDKGTDYTLNEGQVGVWVTVDNVSVHIARRSGGVVVETFPKGDEATDPIARTFTPYETAEDARW